MDRRTFLPDVHRGRPGGDHTSRTGGRSRDRLDQARDAQGQRFPRRRPHRGWSRRGQVPQASAAGARQRPVPVSHEGDVREWRQPGVLAPASHPARGLYPLARPQGRQAVHPPCRLLLRQAEGWRRRHLRRPLRPALDHFQRLPAARRRKRRVQLSKVGLRQRGFSAARLSRTCSSLVALGIAITPSCRITQANATCAAVAPCRSATAMTRGCRVYRPARWANRPSAERRFASAGDRIRCRDFADCRAPDWYARRRRRAHATVRPCRPHRSC